MLSNYQRLDEPGGISKKTRVSFPARCGRQLQKYFNITIQISGGYKGAGMFQKLLIPALIFTLLVSGCISGQPAQGTLLFASSPPGAQIYLDNQYRGTTPSNLSGVDPGSHVLEYRLTGYQNWRSAISVPSGSSTYYAELTPVVAQYTQVPLPGEPGTQSPQQAEITVSAERDPMIVGNSQIFTGTGTPGENVLLMLYGPGKYVNGVQLIQANVAGDGVWSYTWNPGYSVQSGSYLIVVYDARKTVSARTTFAVIGGGHVTVATGRATYTLGDPVQFSGRCTTGAKTVILTLYGPGQFMNGVSLGAQTVNPDDSWSYKYLTSYAMSVGSYTIYAQDAQQTASGSATFSILNG